MKTQREDTSLYWSERGHITCSSHAPHRGSDTWRFGRWRKMTPAEQKSIETELGEPVDCETCNAIKRRRQEAS